MRDATTSALAPHEAASALAVLKREGVSVSFTATTPKQRAFKQHEDDGALGTGPRHGCWLVVTRSSWPEKN
jgi:hypothetical protein